MSAYLLNLVDLILTMVALRNGVPELNPLMVSVPFMVFYKVIVIGLLCWWLSYRQEKQALTLIAAAYSVVIVWHIANL